jgi:lipopolysaccharide/colanic/teichoic acid biosynthesis glycosyltransferase
MGVFGVTSIMFGGSEEFWRSQVRGQPPLSLSTADRFTLGKDAFVNQILREKRRLERTNSPFSLATFQGPADVIERFEQHERLITVLHGVKRSIDVVGYVDDRSVAVLLLECDRQGAEKFVQKVRAHLGVDQLDASVRTYPYDLLECIETATDTQVDPQLDTLIYVDPPFRSAGSRLIKRAFDVLLSCVLVAATLPLWVVTALLVKISSPGAVIYKQQRVGKNGRSFVMYKFRSMYEGSDDNIHREYVAKLIRKKQDDAPDADAGSAWTKMHRDTRISPFGHLIRVTYIDELPQLINVIKGDLSLVGPRPPLAYEVARYEPWHLRRLFSVRPGLTGLWQVEAGHTTTFDDMVRIDLRYVENWSFLLDLKIVGKTFAVVMRGALQHLKGGKE